MRAARYSAPNTLAEAIALLQEIGPRARVLAGGTDLIPQAVAYAKEIDLFVDAKRIPDLMEITFDPESGLTLGAAASCLRVYNNPIVCRHYPGLIDAVSIIGGTAIQGRASVGGNLCNSGPAADSIPALIAYHAAALITGPNGTREVPVEDFCTAPSRNVLAEGELLVSLRLPVPPPRTGGCYKRFIPRNEMDIAEVGVGVTLTLSEHGDTITAARIALGAVAPTPLLAREAGDALVGQPPSEAVFGRAAELARAAAMPITDMRGTVEHRKRLVEVLTGRTLRTALERAQAK